LLVHKAGVVDDRFKKESIGIPLLIPFDTIPSGDSVRIDGETVLKIVDPALESGYALVEAVDAWITSNTPPP
jgi:hypothetical protein